MKRAFHYLPGRLPRQKGDNQAGASLRRRDPGAATQGGTFGSALLKGTFFCSFSRTMNQVGKKKTCAPHTFNLLVFDHSAVLARAILIGIPVCSILVASYRYALR